MISAGGDITGFGSNRATSGTFNNQALTAKNIKGVCRPDMIYRMSGKTPAGVQTENGWLQRGGNGIGGYCVNYSFPIVDSSNYNTSSGSPQHIGPNWGSITSPTRDPRCGQTLISDGTAPAGYSTNDIVLNYSGISGASRITFYVKGDLIIKDDVGHASGQAQDYLLSSLGFVVEGNIYIAGNVKDLYGFYWAKNNIYTCATNKTRITGASSLLASCTNPLRVYGLLSGNNILLDRVGTASTFGLYNAESINPSNPVNPTDTTKYFALLFLAPPPVFDGGFPSTRGGPVTQQTGPPRY